MVFTICRLRSNGCSLIAFAKGVILEATIVPPHSNLPTKKEIDHIGALKVYLGMIDGKLADYERDL